MICHKTQPKLGSDKGVHTSPKDIIIPKGDIIVWLGFELSYFAAAIKDFNHYTTGTLSIYFFTMFYDGHHDRNYYTVTSQCLIF